GHKRLLAYLVPANGTLPELGELRQHVAAKLPEYMVPHAWVFLDALPLSPNGKLDRKALPAPEGRPELESGYVAPRDEAEAILAEIWSGVLRIDQVGVHDNFFELGGDSILSIQVVARAAEHGLRLTSKLLFQHQTIAQLRQVLTDVQAHTPRLSPLGAVELTPIQHEFLQDALYPGHFSQSMLFHLAPSVGVEQLEQALATLLEQHDQLRARFWREDDVWHQEVQATGPSLELVTYDLSELDSEAQEARLEAAMQELQGNRDLKHDSILRAGFFRMGG